MYYIYGISGSSLLIESTDSMIKDDAWNVYTFLQWAAKKKYCVDMYHANLRQDTKAVIIHDRFSKPNSELKCLVATVAYGMVN